MEFNIGSYLSIFVITLLLISCSEQKYFFKSNSINEIKMSPRPDPGSTESRPPDTLVNFKPNKGFRGELKEGDGYITVKPKTAETLKRNRRNVSKKLLFSPDDETKRISFVSKIDELKEKYFIPDVMIDSFPVKTIRYFDTKPVLQTLTTPIKIRPKLTTPALKDSFPSQVSTGINLGIAFGWKFTLNYYQPKPNIFGQKGNKISFAPGIFYGIGSENLAKSNTRDPIITFERSALTHSIGGFGMLGFNSINIGYSFGWDFATGPGKSSWLYQGEMWHGIAFSIDLIK